MKGKTGILCAVLAASMLLLSGCSITGTMQNLVGKVTKDSENENAAQIVSEGVKVEALALDTSMDKPVFQEDLVSIKNVPAGTPVTLEVKASVTDGGTVTYQWFSNNVSSNGGGTAIPEATGETYAPDTSEGGTVFYYVVARNTKNDHVNLATSPIYEVTVWADMYWQQNADLGAFQYMSRIDGRYPSATSMTIDGKDYLFDADGFAITDDGAYLDVQTGEAVKAPAAE